MLPLDADGAAAEYVIAPADVLTAAPKSVPLADSAALPTVGLTAWQALFEVASLTAGQTILINGAGGAVGGYAVQLAKQADAVVTATASTRSADRLRQLRRRPDRRLHRLHDHAARRWGAVRRRAQPGEYLTRGDGRPRRPRRRRRVLRRHHDVGSGRMPGGECVRSGSSSAATPCSSPTSSAASTPERCRSTSRIDARWPSSCGARRLRRQPPARQNDSGSSESMRSEG